MLVRPRHSSASSQRAATELKTKRRPHCRYVVAEHCQDDHGIDVVVVVDDAVASPDWQVPVDTGKLLRLRLGRTPNRFAILSHDVLGGAASNPIVLEVLQPHRGQFLGVLEEKLYPRQDEIDVSFTLVRGAALFRREIKYDLRVPTSNESSLLGILFVPRRRAQSAIASATMTSLGARHLPLTTST